MTLAFSCEVVHEKLWKSVNICKSYSKKISGTFFSGHGVYHRLDRIPPCDRQTDGQTDILPRHRPRYVYASRGNNQWTTGKSAIVLCSVFWPNDLEILSRHSLSNYHVYAFNLSHDLVTLTLGLWPCILAMYGSLLDGVIDKFASYDCLMIIHPWLMTA